MEHGDTSSFGEVLLGDNARFDVRKHEVERSNVKSNALVLSIYLGIFHLSKCARCHSDLFFKRGVERRFRVEATFEQNFEDGLSRRLNQSVLGVSDPVAIDIVEEVYAKGLIEEFGNFSWCHSDLVSKIRQSELRIEERLRCFHVLCELAQQIIFWSARVLSQA